MGTNQLMDNTTFVHKEHQEWLNQLNFYQDEIKFFKKELTLVLEKHVDGLSIIELVEEYKRIFLKKLQHIDELRQQIRLHEKKLSNSLKRDATDIAKHRILRGEFLGFVADMEALKKNFKRFSAHND